MFDISRGKNTFEVTGGKVRGWKGWKVRGWKGWKVGCWEGRLEGLRVENLMEAYTFHNSFLIPSTHKFFVGDLRSPTTNKIYSPEKKESIS